METAKIQNATLDLPAAVRTIQSHGFIVVAGLIFGFDTDPDDIADIALDGILRSGLSSGEPSLLTALPGTPLYQRMKLSGRLRDAKLGLGGFKYQTNIRYLKPEEQIRGDFKKFVARFDQGAYQYQRLQSFYDSLDSANYQAPQTAGYADLAKMLRMVMKQRRHVALLLLRIVRLIQSPARNFYILKAIALTVRRSSPSKPLWFYFKVWLFNWSNSLIKYSRLSDEDFDVESVRGDVSEDTVLPSGYEADRSEQIPDAKIRSQRKLTVAALKGWAVARARTSGML